MGMANLLDRVGSFEHHLSGGDDDRNKECEGGDFEVVISGFDVCLG